MEKWAAGLMLAGNAWQDWRTREISPGWTIFGGSLGFFMGLSKAGNLQEWLAGLLPGSLCLLLAAAAPDSLGFGDGLVLLALGLLLPWGRVLRIVWYGGALCFGVSWILLLQGRGREKCSLPFVPFLFLGYLIEMVR